MLLSEQYKYYSMVLSELYNHNCMAFSALHKNITVWCYQTSTNITVWCYQNSTHITVWRYYSSIKIAVKLRTNIFHSQLKFQKNWLFHVKDRKLDTKLKTPLVPSDLCIFCDFELLKLAKTDVSTKCVTKTA